MVAAVELRAAFRRWRRRPLFVAATVLVLASGIAGTIAVFSLVDALLLRPLPWPHADRLVHIHAVLPDRQHEPALRRSWNRAPISWASWDDLRRGPAFEEVGAWHSTTHVLQPAATDVVDVMYASSSLLAILGAQPQLGRLFTTRLSASPPTRGMRTCRTILCRRCTYSIGRSET